MIRRVLIALALICVAACATASSTTTVTGFWNAEGAPRPGEEHHDPDYFSADLVEQDGRVSARGVINLCPACRGYNEYAINWEGRRDGDRLVLRGIYPDRPFETPVTFTGQISADGERVEGELTDDAGRFRQAWVMLRERNGAAGEEAGSESR